MKTIKLGMGVLLAAAALFAAGCATHGHGHAMCKACCSHGKKCCTSAQCCVGEQCCYSASSCCSKADSACCKKS